MNSFLTSPWPYLTTAALAALTGWYIWHQPRRPGTRYFSWLVCLWLVWSLAAALQVVVQPYTVRYGLFALASVVALVEPVLHLEIALEYTGNEKWLAWRGLNLLFLPAILFASLAVFWPHWVSTVELHSGVQVIQGDAQVKWTFASFSFLMILVSLVVLLNCLLRSPAFRMPLLLLSLGRIIPAAAYFAFDPQRIPISPILATVLSLGFTMLLYLAALYSYRILQITPVARDTVIAHLPYALIVLDSENRLVDFNDLAQHLPEMPAKISLKRAASEVLGAWWERLSPLVGSKLVSRDIPTPAEERIFHASSLPLLQASGRRIGQAFLLEDITEARQSQQQHEQTQRALAMLREREQLARELHDNLSQVLAFTGIQLEAAQKMILDGQAEAGASLLKRLVGVVREAYTDVRENILDLRTAPLPQQPFFSAVHRYLEGFTDNYGIQTMLDVDERLGELPFPQDSRLQVFRILQEALSNARKHSQARCVWISFTLVDSLARLVIQDDGAGFDPAQSVAEGHFGLIFMRERAEVLGGRLEVESAIGKGTRVVLDIPVKKDTEMGRRGDTEARR